MIDAILDILGTYTQLPGDGLASINWVWIVGAITFLMFLWFLMRLVLNLFGRRK